MQQNNWQATASFETIKHRAEIIDRIRYFFKQRSVVEVDTPVLGQATGTDPYLDAFKSSYLFSSSGNEVDLYLQTSPEYAMKRLLASGYGCIYQICKSFRNEPSGSHHNPEFTMLEWYRLGFDHHALIAEVDQLLQTVLKSAPAEKISYQQVFLNTVNIDPLETNKCELITQIKDSGKYSAWHSQEHNLDMLLQFVFAELIEPSIGLDRPCFVYDFPYSQASLARRSEDDPRLAHRFECYFKGLELANGFYELTDAQEQQARFEHDNHERELLAKEAVTIDQHFMAALNHGLPECSGVALGIDRLIMLALTAKSITEVLTFPVDRA